VLNLVSLCGLLVMIGLAWSLSSRKWLVDWRLVVLGIGLQFALAALFFNSQSWTFPKEYRDLDALLSDCSAGQCDPNRVTRAMAASDQLGIEPAEAFEPLAFGELYQRFEAGELTKEELRESFWSSDGGVAQAPRYPNGIIFYGVESFFALIQDSVSAGSSFVFETHADPATDPPTHPKAILTTFAFGVLPTVIFFAALMSVLYYLGVMQRLIRGMAWVMEKTLRTSPAESLAAAANVLVGHTEAPLVIKPYVATMTRSELNALMVGGFATISGSLMAIFANLGISAGHLLTASIISAPAALVIAKIMQPETERPVDLDEAEKSLKDSATNIIEAAANGAAEGMKLALNIAAMLIAFLALITFADILLQQVGSWISVELSLSRIFGLLFYPLAWVMGIAADDCLVAGELLGKKMVVNEFLAYIELSALPVESGNVAATAEALSANGLAVGNNSEPTAISQRTKTILTYALCGFSNFGAIGIQLGGIGPLAPERRGELAQLGLRAMFGGMLAACMTACIAGVFDGWLS
jgi:concentrative nucleoside transporter, CNT family